MLRVAFNSNPFRKESSYSLSLSLCLPVIIFSHRNMLKAREIEEGICACVYFIFISYLFYPPQFKAPFRSLGWPGAPLLVGLLLLLLLPVLHHLILRRAFTCHTQLHTRGEMRTAIDVTLHIPTQTTSSIPSHFSLSFPINPFPPDPFHFGGLQSRLQLQLVLSPTFLSSSTPLLSFFAYTTKMQKCNKMHHHCRE